MLDPNQNLQSDENLSGGSIFNLNHFKCRTVDKNKG
jgi:hypothetical protein